MDNLAEVSSLKNLINSAQYCVAPGDHTEFPRVKRIVTERKMNLLAISRKRRLAKLTASNEERGKPSSQSYKILATLMFESTVPSPHNVKCILT